MSPRHLRAKSRVAIEDMARVLSLSTLDLRVLEETPTDVWPLRVLGAYVAACGYRLKLVAVRDGRDEVLQ